MGVGIGRQSQSQVKQGGGGGCLIALTVSNECYVPSSSLPWRPMCLSCHILSPKEDIMNLIPVGMLSNESSLFTLVGIHCLNYLLMRQELQLVHLSTDRENSNIQHNAV